MSKHEATRNDTQYVKESLTKARAMMIPLADAIIPAVLLPGKRASELFEETRRLQSELDKSIGNLLIAIGEQTVG